LRELLLSFEREKRLDANIELSVAVFACRQSQQLQISGIDELRMSGDLNKWVVVRRLEAVRLKETSELIVILFVVIGINDKIGVELAVRYGFIIGFTILG